MVPPHFPSSKKPNYIEGIFRYRYVKLLRKYGHEIFIVTTKMKKVPSFEEMDGIKIFRVASYSIPIIRYPIPLLPELIKTILEVVKKYEIDIIEFTNHIYLTTLPLIFIRKKINIPIVVSVDGLPNITYFYGNKVVDFFGMIHTLTLGKLVLKRADAIRLSHAALKRHLMKEGMSQNKLKVIYNAVDLRVFHCNYDKEQKRRELGVNENEMIILFVGRLDKVKGVDHLIDVAKNLVKQFDNLKFILVGEGSMYRTLRRKTSGLEKKIIFTGLRRDIASLMNAADVFVLPSISEGCPNTILEAAAVGKPIVASRVGAIPEILKDGETGFLVKPGSKQELEEAICEIIQNPQKAEKRGQEARESVMRKFNMDIVGKNINAFYGRVMKKTHLVEGI